VTAPRASRAPRARRRDFEHLPTERPHPAAGFLEKIPSTELARLMVADHAEVLAAVGRSVRPLVRLAEGAADALRAGGRLIYVGAGTSGRLGALDAAECPPTFGTRPAQVVAVIAGGPRALRRAVEGAEDDAGAGARALARLRVDARDLVVGLSASGGAPFVVGALAEAKRRGAATGLVACARPVANAARVCAVLETGPELVAGSTRLKAGSATKLALNLISTLAMVRLGKVYRGRMVDLRATNEKLRDRAERLVRDLGGVARPRANTLLREARGSARVAIAMAARGVGAAAARRLLRDAGGRLDRVVERARG
jgi:N-acetylmuramic acid 6-phosphate etherase